MSFFQETWKFIFIIIVKRWFSQLFEKKWTKSQIYSFFWTHHCNLLLMTGFALISSTKFEKMAKFKKLKNKKFTFSWLDQLYGSRMVFLVLLTLIGIIISIIIVIILVRFFVHNYDDFVIIKVLFDLAVQIKTQI